MSYTLVTLEGKDCKLKFSFAALKVLQELYEEPDLTKIYAAVEKDLINQSIGKLLYSLLETFHPDKFNTYEECEPFVDSLDVIEASTLFGKVSDEFLRGMGARKTTSTTPQEGNPKKQ